MTYFFLVFLEIIFLFFLSRIVSRTLSRFLPVSVLSMIFLPGVIVHELSHWFVAAIMLVKVGEIEFGPKIEDGGLKLGSAMVAKTDPVRRTIIGFAPVFVGISIILGIVYFQFTFSSFWGGGTTTPESGFWSHFVRQNDVIGTNLFISIITLYLLFVISNTMFSSKADMEGTLELLIAALVIFSALYFAGFRFPPSFTKILLSDEVIHLVQKSSMFLTVPLAIDLAILGIVRAISRKA